MKQWVVHVDNTISEQSLHRSSREHQIDWERRKDEIYLGFNWYLYPSRADRQRNIWRNRNIWRALVFSFARANKRKTESFFTTLLLFSLRCSTRPPCHHPRTQGPHLPPPSPLPPILDAAIMTLACRCLSHATADPLPNRISGTRGYGRFKSYPP